MFLPVFSAKCFRARNFTVCVALVCVSMFFSCVSDVIATPRKRERHYLNTHLERRLPTDVVQAAVPKYVMMEMRPPTGNCVPADQSRNVSQTIRVNNTMLGQKNLMMRMKIQYMHNGAEVLETSQVSSFPSGY